MSSSSQNPEPTTFLVMIGGTPLAAAASLEAAKAEAFTRETRSGERGEYHWTEARPAEWRLISRWEGAKRFSWTHYWIATVPSVGSQGGAS